MLSIYPATINLIQIIYFIHKKDAICCIHDAALVKLWNYIFYIKNVIMVSRNLRLEGSSDQNELISATNNVSD